MKTNPRQFGFGIIGIIIALIIVGALTAMVVPMLLSKFIQSAQGSDRKALEAAMTAIVGYTFSRGQLPCQVNAGGACVTGAAALMPPSAGVGAVPALGVNNYGVFGRENPFRMDSNDALAAVTTGNIKDLCRVAQAQMTAPGAGPRLCQDAACATTAPMAFVLYSTGHDHLPNLNNALGTRIYENDNRGLDNSAGATHYDDQVVSYPLSSLVSACSKLGGVPVCTLNATPSTITPPATSTLTVSCSNNPTSYTWSNPPGFAANQTTGTVSPIVTTTYTVTGTNELGAGPTASATVIVTSITPAPSCTITPASASVQQGATSQLFTAVCSNSPASWAWTLDGNPVGVSAASYTTANNLSVATHVVGVTATNVGGSGSAAASLIVNAVPVPVCASITPSTQSLALGYSTSTQLAATCSNSPAAWVWKIDGGTAVNTAVNTYTVPTGLAAGTHTVTVTANNAGGNGITAASATVTVTPASPCSVGQTKIVVNNASGNALHYKINDTGSCLTLNTGTTDFACQSAGYFVAVKGVSGCSSAIGSASPSSDTNLDGTALCTVNSSLTMTCN